MGNGVQYSVVERCRACHCCVVEQPHGELATMAKVQAQIEQLSAQLDSANAVLADERKQRELGDSELRALLGREKEARAEDEGAPSKNNGSQQPGSREQPPPSPEAVGAYSKKSEESTGGIAMIDSLVKDMDQETSAEEVSRKNAQTD